MNNYSKPMQEILDRLSKIQNGFKPIEIEAKIIFESNSMHISKQLALGFFESEYYQIRSLGVFILGFISSQDLESLQILRTKISADPSWQVQEILAKAFDQYCKDAGYEQSLQIIE